MTHVPADLGEHELDTLYLTTKLKRTKARVSCSVWAGDRLVAGAQDSTTPGAIASLMESCLNSGDGVTKIDSLFRGAALRWARFNHFSF